MPRYWLFKSEPNSYSIDHLRSDGRTHWNGVRNFQARNLLRDEIKKGDLVFFYHSNAEPPGVAGVAEVVREAYPDPSAREPDSPYFDPKDSEENPRWYVVDIAFSEKFTSFIPLPVLKETPGLEKMVVTTRSRLSVQPVSAEEFDIVSTMGRERS